MQQFCCCNSRHCCQRSSKGCRLLPLLCEAMGGFLGGGGRMSNNLSLRTILTDCKFNDTNFLDWHRNVLIVLIHEKIEYVLDGSMPQESEPTAPAAVRNTYKKHKDDNREVSCIMIASMTSQLQQQHMNMGAYDIVQHLRELFEQQSRTVRYDTSKELFRCKMAEGAPVARMS
ncbi:uncharacterized protein [Coffea arabica]|uniref:Uncharacterized protein n=1 Tax=Coffea arabica TaxID=13443 RepID=A0A6P6USI5_COFAR|nr:uncharacterized protein LOC113714154 [Coffea arabica]